MIVTSFVENFAARDCGKFCHEAGHVYLFSPLSSWQGSVSIGGRMVHQGWVRPGMMRLSFSRRLERQCAPPDASALIICIPEQRLPRMIAGLKVRPSTSGMALTPIDFVDQRVRKLVQILTPRNAIPEDSRPLVTEGVAQALLGLLIAHHHHRHDRVQRQSSVDCLSDAQMQSTCRFADRYPDESVTIQKWAAHLGLTPQIFARRFYRSTGTTPHAWLLERRMQRARELLRNTSEPISDLALRLGFASQSHLTETFRRLTGTSPARWRASKSDGI